MADDEFADIDWSAAVDMDPTQHVGVTGDENDNVVDNQNNPLFCNVVQDGTMMMQHQQQQPTAVTAPQNSSSSDDMETLRNQILRLQNELHSKDETINDLQNSAVSTQLESSHRIKTAEEEAKRKIHLVQEELRRVKMEADKYKGSWVRTKKRVTELEQNNNSGNTNGTAAASRTTNRVSHDNNLENGVNLSTFGFPTDIETRRVTPNNLFGNDNSNECAPATTTTGFQPFESDAAVVSGSKRKMMEQPSIASAGLTTVLPRSVISQTMSQYDSLSKRDTVVQRMTRHLIMRDEMGCYSFTPAELSLLDVASEDSGKTQDATANLNESSGTIHHSIQQALAKGEETRSYVRSILHQILDTDCNVFDRSVSSFKHVSSSGLFFMLLTRLNSSFGHIKAQVEDDNDHLMEHDPSIAFGSVSSISVLYVLRVMCDMLLLSAKTRDDLRCWLYQSQQPLGSAHEQKNNASSSAAAAAVHSRIEGLSSNQITPDSNDSKEALWTRTCYSTLNERGNEWDPMTMSQPCSTFFEILVATMTGNSYGSNSFDLESKGDMKQLIRERAIRLVLTLMSDAPRYRVESVGRTPYLWKYWFDSLFPTKSMNEGDAENTSQQAGDFFSLWEVTDGRGSGRKRCSRPMAQEAPKSDKQKRSNNGTFRSRTNDINNEQEEHLSIKVKCGIIQLLTHLVVSSSSVYRAIYEPTGPEGSPLARRVLAAILDEIDGCIVPLLSSSISKAQTQKALNYLELCCSCNQFILALSRSNEGIQMTRYQMIVESEKDGQTYWSHSAISCMALVLNSVLSCATSMEQEEITPKWAADMSPYLNRTAEQCISFFKTLQSFAHNQKRNSSKSKPPTFTSLISEQHLVLLSCFQKLSTREHNADAASCNPCILWIRDELKYDIQVMMEEALYDDV